MKKELTDAAKCLALITTVLTVASLFGDPKHYHLYTIFCLQIGMVMAAFLQMPYPAGRIGFLAVFVMIFVVLNDANLQALGAAVGLAYLFGCTKKNEN